MTAADGAPVPAGWDCHIHVFDTAAPALAGHYQPADAGLDEIEAQGRAHGIGHLVLVQPSVYGTDNSLLVRALHAGGGRHRGVAVVSPQADARALDALHAAGVRGIRFNLVSPVGTADDGLEALAPLLQARGWHVQWYVGCEQLPRLVALQRRVQMPFVFDHLAGLGLSPAPTAAAWRALQQLAEGGAWLKLSGWYRLGSVAPYADMTALVQRAAAPFGDRLVWGSDWPHTALPRTHASRQASLLEPVRAALGDEALRQILEANPLRLYDATTPRA